MSLLRGARCSPDLAARCWLVLPECGQALYITLIGERQVYPNIVAQGVLLITPGLHICSGSQPITGFEVLVRRTLNKIAAAAAVAAFAVCVIASSVDGVSSSSQSTTVQASAAQWMW